MAETIDISVSDILTRKSRKTILLTDIKQERRKIKSKISFNEVFDSDILMLYGQTNGCSSGRNKMRFTVYIIIIH